MRINICVILYLLLTLETTYSQSGFFVEGQLISKNPELIKNVTIEGLSTTATDSTGYFKLFCNNKKPGEDIALFFRLDLKGKGLLLNNKSTHQEIVKILHPSQTIRFYVSEEENRIDQSKILELQERLSLAEENQALLSSQIKEFAAVIASNQSHSIDYRNYTNDKFENQMLASKNDYNALIKEDESGDLDDQVTLLQKERIKNELEAKIISQKVSLIEKKSILAGDAYFLNLEFDKAEKAYRRAYGLNPDNRLHKYNFSLFLTLIGKHEEAIDLLKSFDGRNNVFLEFKIKLGLARNQLLINDIDSVNYYLEKARIKLQAIADSTTEQNFLLLGIAFKEVATIFAYLLNSEEANHHYVSSLLYLDSYAKNKKSGIRAETMETISEVYTALAWINGSNGVFHLAQQYSEKALQISQLVYKDDSISYAPLYIKSIVVEGSINSMRGFQAEAKNNLMLAESVLSRFSGSDYFAMQCEILLLNLKINLLDKSSGWSNIEFSYSPEFESTVLDCLKEIENFEISVDGRYALAKADLLKKLGSYHIYQSEFEAAKKNLDASINILDSIDTNTLMDVSERRLEVLSVMVEYAEKASDFRNYILHFDQALDYIENKINNTPNFTCNDSFLFSVNSLAWSEYSLKRPLLAQELFQINLNCLYNVSGVDSLSYLGQILNIEQAVLGIQADVFEIYPSDSIRGVALHTLRRIKPLIDKYKNLGGKKELLEYIQNHVNFFENASVKSLSINDRFARACQKGFINIAEDLYLAGADIEYKFEGKSTPLQIAASNGHYEVYRWLLDHDANINVIAPYPFNMTLLHLASFRGHYSIVKDLINRGLAIDAKCSIVFSMEDVDIKNGSPVKQKTQSNLNTVEAETSPLMLAVFSGSPETVKVLLENNAQLDVYTSQGLSIFDIACMGGNLSIIKLLFEQGFNLNTTRSSKNMFPLHIAISSNHYDVVKWLIESGSDLDLTNIDGRTPMSLAILLGRLDIVKLLIQARGSVDFIDINGGTPLFLAMTYKQEEIAIYLIENGANTSRKVEGISPIFYATYMGLDQLIDPLITHGADFTEKMNSGEDLLVFAVQSEDTITIQKILDLGFNLNQETRKELNPLAIAIQNGNLSLSKFLISKGANLKVFPYPAFCLIQRNDKLPEMFKMLMDEGLKVDDKTSDGQTTLHFAMRFDKYGLAMKLLEHGADPNIQSVNGDTPLHIAVEKQKFELVKMLVDHGADAKIIGRRNLNALDIAILNGDANIIQALNR